MPLRYLSALTMLLAAGSASVAWADDVRFFEENGVTYRETKCVTKRPVSETHFEDRQQTVYSQQFKTQTQTIPRTYQVPVTEYYLESYLVNRWNPFAQPYLASRYVLRTRWETRTDQVQVPIVRAEWVPQQRTVKVPVTTQRLVDEEQTSKVAVSVRPGTTTDPFAQSAAGISAAQQPSAAGGVHLDSDPPRGGTAWHPGDQAVQR